MEVPTWGRVLVASGYFEVKSGLGKVNLEGLQRLGQALTEEELPFVVAADWNLKPEVLTSSEFPKRAAAVVIAKDGVPTCISKKGRNILDYFLVESGMAATVTGIEVDVDSGIAPHRPSMIIFAAKAIREHTISWKGNRICQP